MEDKFYNDEFEQFLRQQANNHRMYPSDGVWQVIYKKLHGDKRWPALTIAAFAFLTATIAISVYFAPKPNIFAIAPVSPTSTAKESTNTPGFNNPLNSLTNTTNNNSNTADYITQETSTVSLQTPAKVTIDQIPQAVAVKEENNTTAETRSSASSTPTEQSTFALVAPGTEFRVAQPEPTGADPIDLPEVAVLKKETSVIVDEKSESLIPEPGLSNTVEQNADNKNIGNEVSKQPNNDLSLYNTPRKASAKKRVSYTVYIAPSVSYRKLKDETVDSKNVSLNGPVGLNYVTDVNKIVRHKPGTGVEAGVGFKYHLSNTFGIKAGLQFNIRQYNIEAYKSPIEVATIELLRGSGVDTINTYAVYRNNNGNVATELINRYYQIAFPIGIEWEVIGNNTVKFNVAANVQPTYNMNRNSYLLSTNFKNYTEDPGMLRNWNINSNIEAFLSIKAGDYRWQIGPQFRYQHLPTFMTQYPIREYLMDYGFKIGVSKFIK